MRHGRAAGAEAWARGARVAGALDARQKRQARGRASGDTTMLACDKTEGPAMSRPRLLRHGASARSARNHEQLGHRMGVRAGSTGPSWCTVHLA